MKFRLTFSLFCLMFYFFFSCVETPEFAVGAFGLDGQEFEATTNMGGIISSYEQANQPIFSFRKTDNLIIDAYVISSDEAGNFYKTLVVQDHFENPSYGLEIKIDLRSYFVRYNFGRKLLLKLGGLSMQKVNGKYVVGYLLKGIVEEIPTSLLDDYIVRLEQTEQIIPEQIELQNVSTAMMNRYVELNNVQFSQNDVGKTYSSEVYDTYNGERIIEQCTGLERTLLFSSVYAKFKTQILPEQTFHIRAVLSSDYYSGNINLMLNSLHDLHVSQNSRCDPEPYDCKEKESEDLKRVIFYENFDALKSSSDLNNIGWHNLNVNFGSAKFRKRSSNDNIFVQVSAYNTDEYVMDAWLISPEIDLSKEESAILSFDSRATFEEGSALTLWYSSDYKGDFFDANWHQLKAEVSIGSRDDANRVFKNSGQIQLGCLQKKIHLAFRYLGADPGISTTYDIDNILILGEYQ